MNDMSIVTDDTEKSIEKQLFDYFYGNLKAQQVSTVRLMVDTTLRPIEPDEPLGELFHLQEATTLPIVHDDVDEKKCAQLIEVDVNTEAAILEQTVYEAYNELHPDMLKHGIGRRICAWIISDASTESIAAHWGDNSLQRNAAGDLVWLRLHDPAVLWLLWYILDPQQRVCLLGAVDVCCILDPRGHWVALRRSEDTPASYQPLVIRDEQWQDIELISTVNLVLKEIPVQIQLSAERLINIRPTIFNALRTAKRQYRLTDTQDLALFAIHTLRYGVDFHLKPDINAMLQRRKADEFYSLISSNFVFVSHELR